VISGFHGGWRMLKARWLAATVGTNELFGERVVLELR
jgi:hypothetical protein